MTDVKKKDLSSAEAAHLIGDILLEMKAADLVVMDVSTCSDIADYMVVATGTSRRQIQAMAEDVRVQLKEHGRQTLSLAGRDHGWWVLIDYGDVVVHVMQEEARRYYDLEALWADGRVVRRLGAATT